ncbi:MAG TPA: hypothetical protein VNX40_04030 [Mucilaginibacter sp.]|jgi:hypothetical protein|nr:hypothetical protein [Mucilaginibacter sp.]
MKFFIVIALAFYFYIPVSYSQLDSVRNETDKEIIDKIQVLHDKKIDTLVYYHVECTGYMTGPVSPDSCFAYDVKYLLWIDNQKYFIQRFDECFKYEPSNITSSFFDVVRHNFFRIKNNEIRNPQFTEVIKGKKVDLESFVDHSCINIFEIHIGSQSLTKKIDQYDLETKYVDGHLNKNYYTNKKSILIKLKMIAEKEVAFYNKNLHHKKDAH